MELTILNREGESKKFEISDRDVRDFIEENWEEVEEKINLVLKIGVGAIKASSTTVDTNYVDKEFQKLSTEFNERFRKFQEEWDRGIESVFGEDFRKMQECMDPDRPNTPNRKTIEYMDDRIKQLIQEMDPNEEGTPIGKFRKEMLNSMQEVLKEVAVKKMVAEEKEKGTAKGVEYEDDVFTALQELGTVHGDSVFPTGKEPGAGGNKKGDVVIEISDIANLRLVFEAKKKSIAMTQKFYDDEIKGSLENRAATKAILVVHPDYNPGKAPLFFWKDAIVVEYDPDIDDRTALSVAYQLSRKLAIETVTKGKDTIDLSRFRTQLMTVLAYVDHISKIEGGITNSMNSLDKVKRDAQDTKEKLKEALNELLEQLEVEDDE